MANLEAAQQEMSERQKVARSRQARKNGGTRKPKRARRSVISLLTELASHPDARSRDRLRAIQQILLLKGKPVLPDLEGATIETETKPRITGADLGPEVART